jgi:hypothetical protein
MAPDFPCPNRGDNFLTVLDAERVPLDAEELAFEAASVYT